ncbi:hypothetical protein DOY81_008618 [Sarcophaga bullata]|nr:hypothetical protein DOY81_008618 [Sarcophaga bullata]
MCDGRLISRNGDDNWPPSTCDLTPLEYFLWGVVKEKFFGEKPETNKHMKANIRDPISVHSKIGVIK